MDPNEIVTVVNRTSKALLGTHDGKPYDIPPGESHFPLFKARYFRYQNPVMGLGTPLEDWSSKSEYLVAIKELGDDCSPTEQTDAIQRWDTTLVNGANVEVIRPRGGGYKPEVKQSVSLAYGTADNGTGFTKP